MLPDEALPTKRGRSLQGIFSSEGKEDIRRGGPRIDAKRFLG